MHAPYVNNRTESIHSHLMHSSSENPRKLPSICINLTLPEIEVAWLHFAADNIVLPSLKFLWWAPKNVLCNRVWNGHSRSSKAVVDFGTNQKHICDLILVVNSNLGPNMHHFWDTATLVEPHNFSQSPSQLTLPLGVSPFEPPDQGSAKSSPQANSGPQALSTRPAAARQL